MATGAVVHVLHVVPEDGDLAAVLGDDGEVLRSRAAGTGCSRTSVRWHVPPVSTYEPGARVLDRARSWPADLVVLGRADRRGPGEPYIGHHTRHVLEFAEQAVITVPPP